MLLNEMKMQQFSSQLSTLPPSLPVSLSLCLLRSALYLVYFFVAAAAATPAALCHKAVIKFGCTKEGEWGRDREREGEVCNED